MTQHQTCDASVISHLTDPPAMIGPCILRHGHDGPSHKAANGTSWTALDRPLGSRLLIDDRTAERRAEQADQPEFIEVASYRTDAGHTAWAMRCWGAGTCDGLVSLDHDTERWAVVARDRHLAEAHNATTPQAGQPQADGPLLLDRAAADALRERYAAAMLEHYITDEADVDGNRFCSCTEWGEGPDEHWDYHLADVFLAVRDDEVAQLRRQLAEAGR